MLRVRRSTDAAPSGLRERALARLCAGLLAIASTLSPAVGAQAWVPERGKGSVSVTYQHNQSTRLTNANGDAVRFGKVIDRGLDLSVDYGLSDRWALSADMPYKSNRYTGDDPHDPATQLPFANNQRFIDDGQYHSGWADWSVALRYQLRSKPFLVTPFIAYSRPSHDYTFWAHSALGNQQRSWQAGVNLGGWLPPPWQQLYWQAGYAYLLMERVSDRRVNRGVLSAQLGCALTPRLGAQLRIEHQNSFGATIDLPKDFLNPDGSLNPGNLLYHDQLAASRFTRASVGMSYQLSERYQLSAAYARTIRAANAHIWDHQLSIGISRSF